MARSFGIWVSRLARWLQIADPEEASPALVLTMSGDTRLVCCAMGLRQPDKSRTSVRSARTRTLVRFRVIAANSTMRVLFP